MQASAATAQTDKTFVIIIVIGFYFFRRHSETPHLFCHTIFTVLKEKILNGNAAAPALNGTTDIC